MLEGTPTSCREESQASFLALFFVSMHIATTHVDQSCKGWHQSLDPSPEVPCPLAALELVRATKCDYFSLAWGSIAFVALYPPTSCLTITRDMSNHWSLGYYILYHSVCFFFKVILFFEKNTSCFILNISAKERTHGTGIAFRTRTAWELWKETRFEKNENIIHGIMMHHAMKFNQVLDKTF